jgi:hypothetical protein
MRFAPLSVVLALALVGVASANHLDPQKQIRPVDQRRASAMLLRASDLPGYETERTSNLDPHLTCRGLDESDLVVTGRARSPYWSRDYRIVGSSSAVYRTRSDSAAAWRRGKSAVGRRCLRQAFVDELEQQGETVRVSVGSLVVPPLGVERTGVRLAITGASPARRPVVTLDLILLRDGRGQVALLFAAVVVPPDRGSQIALARTAAKRLAKAMKRTS